jgi:hypothetical protein
MPYRWLLIFGGTLIVASFFWYGKHAGFEGRTALLVESANSATVAQTVAGFAQTRQFVERTTSSGRFQESSWKSRTVAEQKDRLIKNLDISVVQNGGVIVIRFFDTSEEGALVAANESLETLVRMARNYEGADGLSVRVLDEPFVEKTFYAVPWFVLEVFLTALLSTLLLELLVRAALFGLAGMKKEQRSHRTTPTPEHFVPERIDSFQFPPEALEPEALDEIPVYEPVQQTSFEKKPLFEPTAPQTGLQSVSMSMEDLPFKLETPEPSAEAAPKEDSRPAAQAQEESVVRSTMPEPSVVEYKRRLNELLQG